MQECSTHQFYYTEWQKAYFSVTMKTTKHTLFLFIMYLQQKQRSNTNRSTQTHSHSLTVKFIFLHNNTVAHTVAVFSKITHTNIVNCTILLCVYSMHTKCIHKTKARQIFPLEHNNGWAHTTRSHATQFFIQFFQLSFINCRGCDGEGEGG